jgi:hypothetical protein
VTTIITREIGASPKGSPLTNSEVDQNFINLNTDKAEKASPTFTGTVTLPTSLLNVTTSSYPTIRPSLNLDFANSMSVDPRITFTRASTATRVRQDGLVEVVASGSPRIDFDPATAVCKGLLIEEQRTNLLTYSENFDNVAWTKSRSQIDSNVIVAPDGTLTADKLVEDTQTGSHHTGKGAYSFIVSTTYCLSVYVKAAERSNGTLVLGNGIALFGTGGNAIAHYDLIAGTCVISNSNASSAGIQNISNGWFRVWLVATCTTGAADAFFGSVLRNGTATTTNYTGDGVSGLYLWGAQLEVGAFPTSYIPSSDTFTSRASTATYVDSNGLIQSALTNVARYDYNPVNLALAPKLLLERASTNLLTYSEQFDNAAWAKNNATVTANATTAPDGTLTADKMVQNTANTTHLVKQGAITTNTNPLSATIYAKAGERTNLLLQLQENTSFARYVFCVFDLTTGTAGSVTNSGGASSSTASCTSVGNGWFRCSIISTLGGVDTNSQLVAFDGVSLATYTGDGTSGIYIWGAQLEAGSFPTSYIPTVASQVTRAADISSSAQTTRVADNAVMTGTNFSSWYNQTEGTVVASFRRNLPTATVATYPAIMEISSGSYSDNHYIAIQTSTNWMTAGSRTNSTYSADIYVANQISTTVPNFTSYGYKLNDFVHYSNLGANSDASGTVPVGLSTLKIGSGTVYPTLNGHISKLSYYPKRLTNSELQALTTG